MRLTCNASSHRKLRPRAACVIALAVCGCGAAEGVVGRQHSLDAAAPGFETDFASNGELWDIETSLPRASVSFGNTDSHARDGYVAQLVFPGDASITGADNVGPDFVTQISTRERFGFGTLRTRVSFGGCAGTEEVVQAVLGYFSDGEDSDNNGITDDIEIDLQVTCGTPHLVYLSVFTDYQASSAGIRFRKLGHIVDLSTGNEYDSPRDDSDTYVPSGNNPALLKPTLATTADFYEVGYEWHRDRVRFFLNDGTEDLTLWALTDTSHVPQQPVYLMYNLWHPESHWFPNGDSADFPSIDVAMKLDWIRFDPSSE